MLDAHVTWRCSLAALKEEWQEKLKAAEASWRKERHAMEEKAKQSAFAANKSSEDKIAKLRQSVSSLTVGH